MKMKKNLFMVAAVALIAAVSCNKMEDNNGFENQEPSYFVEFTADAANEDEVSVPSSVQTKTTYNESSKKTLWEASDLISVNGKKFKIKELSSDKLSAKFVNDENLGATFKYPFFAVYPYAAGMTFSGTSVSGIKVNDTPGLDTKGSNIAIAYQASGNVLSFKNVTSMIRFSVDMDGVTEVEISSNNGTEIAGTAEVSWNNGTPKVEKITNGSSTITIKGNFVKGTKYYVNVLPQTLATGITIRLNGIIAKTKKTSVTLGRSKVMKSENLKLTESKWKLTGNFTDNGHSRWTPATGIKLYTEEGVWHVAKNVSMQTCKNDNGSTASKAEFKITDGSWNTSFGAEWCDSNIGKWLTTNGNVNAFAAKGVYDIYFDETNARLMAAPAGSKALTVYSSWTKWYQLWAWGDKTEITSATGFSYPGPLRVGTENIDNYEYAKWMLVIPANSWGEKMSFIFSKDNAAEKIQTSSTQVMTNVMFYNGENAAFLK